ncbi:hypothetical protein L7F22_058993 [Adiantum nelumboides]|nr:hypothetical protein [Adiantum nelumboides]
MHKDGEEVTDIRTALWEILPESAYRPAKHQPSLKVSALAVIASHRFRYTTQLRVCLLRGTPLSRLRSCVYVIISIERLRKLPLQRARREKYLLSMQRYYSSHHTTFRSCGYAIVFCLKLVHKLHVRHTECDPLHTALDTISEALNFKLEQAINSGKCKVLLEVFSSISSLLSIMRFVLDNRRCSLDMAGYRGLSACYYTLKELCRMLSMCKQYIQDCRGSVPSRRVFAKLENVHTIKFLLLDLYKHYQLLVIKFDSFVNSICDPVAQEFAWDHNPPCLPGSFMGHYLQLQAEKDLSQVLADLKQHPRSFWSNFMGSWRKILNAAEDVALRKLLLERLNYPIVGHGNMEYLKRCMYVDKKHIRIVRFLGSGYYGKVEEVLCFGEKYAMKTIKGLQAVEDAQEAVVHARLHHPNIVKLMWYTLNFDSQNSLSLLMDLMITSLEDYIEQEAHSGTPSRLFNAPLVSLDIMMQIAAAMRYLHSQCVMHRDLKAANVLVGTWNPDTFNEGYVHVKVADFGFAKVKQVGSQTQLHSWKVGTGYWRAPEVFWQEHFSSSDSTENVRSSDHCPNYTLSADVYSFAMTCYEIITGKKPFADLLKDGMKPKALKEKIVKSHERPTLPPSLHPGLKDLIERCWDGRPESRPSFGAICQQLDQVRDDFVFGSHH